MQELITDILVNEKIAMLKSSEIQSHSLLAFTILN